MKSVRSLRFPAFDVMCRGVDAQVVEFSVPSGNLDCYVLVDGKAYRNGNPPALFAGLSDVNFDGMTEVLDCTYLHNCIFRDGPFQPICYRFEY